MVLRVHLLARGGRRDALRGDFAPEQLQLRARQADLALRVLERLVHGRQFAPGRSQAVVGGGQGAAGGGQFRRDRRGEG